MLKKNRLCLCFIAIIFCLTPPIAALAKENQPFQLGIIADCQYADKADKGVLFYRSCPAKLSEAITHLNTKPLQAIVQLGDLIDEDYQSFTPLIPILQQSKAPLYHVLGNHEYSVADQYKMDVVNLLSMPARYYSFVIADWRFIVLDGTDVSYYGWPEQSHEHQQNMQLIKAQYPEGKPWNGAIGKAQLAWLSKELSSADQKGHKVAILNHFALYPLDHHVLWNQHEVMTLISAHPSVKVWFNGHNHKGDYARYNGIHFVTFKGMLDTADTAYSIATFEQNHIEIQGIGRQPSLLLSLD